MYGRLGRGAIPKLLYANDKVLSGGVRHSQTLFNSLESTLGVRKIEP
jgi:hypothetical protein